MNVGGTANYVRELVDGIPGSLLVTGYVQELEVEDVSTQTLPILRIPHLGRKISLLNDFRSWLELRKIIKEQAPCIVHTHTFKAGLIGRLISGPHKRVHTFHGHLFADYSFPPVERYVILLLERFLSNRTDVLISVGKRVGEELRLKRVGIGRLWVSIPPGVKPLSVIKKSTARTLLAIDRDSLQIGWMARVTEVKDPLLLVEIAQKLPHVNLVMAGGGNLLKAVKAKAPKNLKVLGWCNPTNFWSAVDCALSTSVNEGMPIALIEAQLAGIPVIATNVGSISEVVEDGVTGIVTRPNVTELTHAIEKLISNSKLRGSMEEAAKVRSRRKFSVENMIEAHSQVYDRLFT
jgi:glycosyltransferase involved in cell wall biosynthesis